MLFRQPVTRISEAYPAVHRPKRRVTPSAFAVRAAADRPTDLPDGRFGSSAVQPYFQKYFHSRLTQIKTISLAVSSPRGAYRDRHGRGMGCGGRGSVGRAV